jgi:CheY-like chemotaxis protein
VVELLGYNLRSSGVHISLDIPPDLPLPVADRDQIHQVIANLVINANQALDEKGGSDRRIAIAAQHTSADAVIEITVSDNGPGIPPAIRSRIFEPFFSTKPQGTGTGIGLAISRDLIEAHGGTLGLLDQTGPGATFVVRLPSNTGTAATGTTGRGQPRPASRGRKGSVLVVDDEQDIVDLLKDLIERLNFEVLSAPSGNAAIRMLSTMTPLPEVILCDIRMPDGDGPALYGWLAANRPALTERIAFLTGDPLGSTIGRFLARCDRPVLEKPFTPADIQHLIESLLEPLPGAPPPPLSRHSQP